MALSNLQLNESFTTGDSGVCLIPYEEFYVPELREKFDLRKDFVSWLHASGSSVLQHTVVLPPPINISNNNNSGCAN